MTMNDASRSPPARSIGTLLNGAAGELKVLMEHTRRLERISRVVRNRLPAPLGSHCCVANITQQTLVLHADSPAWITKLRYHCPDLLDHLHRQPDLGQLRDIRIRAVPANHAQSSRQAPARCLPASAARLLRSAASATSSPALKDALLRMAERGQSGNFE